MKTTARFLLFLAAVQLAFAQPTVPISNLYPVTANTLVGGGSTTGRGTAITAGSGITIANGTISATGGGSVAPSNATYITQTPNSSLTNEQPLSLLSTGIMAVTTGTGVITSLGSTLTVPNGGSGLATVPLNSVILGNTTGAFKNVAPGTSGNVLTSNGTSWLSSAPATSGNVTAAGTLTSGDIVIGQGAKTIATSSVFSISGSNATVSGNLTITGGTTFNNLTTANLSVTGNITATGVGNGTLLIGNTTGGNFAVSTLTQGSGVTITNGAGTITISATGSGGNVTGSGLTANAIVIGAGSSAVSIGASPGTSGNVLTSNGTAWTSAAAATGNVTVSGTPTSGQLASWTSATNIQGVTSANVTQGGTGLGTLTANNIITGNGTGAVTFIAPGTSGNVVTSNGTAFVSTPPTALSMTATLGTDDTYNGATLAGLNAGATIAQWEAVYVDGSSTYQLADANGSGTYPARGLAVAAYSSSNAAIIIREGVVRNDAWNWTPGGTIYISGTPGAITQTAPSASGDKVQQVGFALTADIAYFNFASGEYLTVQ